MTRIRFGRFVLAWAVALLAAAGWAGPSVVSGAIRVDTVAAGLDTPWALAFLPDGRMLVSERPGRLRVIGVNGDISAPVRGVPPVHAVGQGGLLDVVLSPDFVHDRRIYFSFAQSTGAGARTAVARAVLDADALTLTDVHIVFGQLDDPPGGYHFGSRLAFALDGTLFITLGERNAYRDAAQDLASHLGKIVRVDADGRVPADNPFIGRVGVRPEIWSYGHRNVQGAVIDPVSGALWTHEHGPQGGDELNQPPAGANHGWPVITYGREYVTGGAIGEGVARADVEPPRHQWTPSIAPSGMAIYAGALFPGWQGDVLVGSLKFGTLHRLRRDGGRVVGEEVLLAGVTRRIRDVRLGPEGAVYVLDESGGRVLRLSPR
ncbi:MAG: PQQ-dependent sugar dehydrogenase [Rhodocyclaceae bacterium]|nr:PQQ-dependent sugar dehydrogenase [Rhodocyclaceae bacterium]